MSFNSLPTQWGWSSFFQNQINPEQNDAVIARVLNQEKNLYQLVCFSSDQPVIVRGELKGKFRHEHGGKSMEYPGVGDWVLCQLHSDGTAALIDRVLERKSCFYRREPGMSRAQVVAANVDVIFITMSANQDFNLKRLDRYMSIAWDSGAVPVILLNKADLCQDIDGLVAEVQEHHAGVLILPISAFDAQGVQTVRSHLKPGMTAVLLGSSGVGKSTLTNALLGAEVMTTQGIRSDDEKGRHTTTSRQLFLLPEGGLVMDTPGMRSLGLLDQQQGIESQFEDIVILMEQCRFSDCAHQSEPGCAVKRALQEGEISEERWESYEKLQREVLNEMRRKDPVARQQDIQKWKKISMQIRATKKLKGR